MVNDAQWRGLLDQAVGLLGLKVVSYCEDLNNKEMPRYFHADCLHRDLDDHQWRLKVVNQWRSDVAGIQNCLSYHNRVHPLLLNSLTLVSIVRIPAYFPIPSDHSNTIGCSELISGGRKPDVEDIPLLVETLLNLQTERTAILQELTQLNGEINRYNRSNYRTRLVQNSGESLVMKQLLTQSELECVAQKYDKWFADDLPDDSLTIVHGDFAFGNLMVLDEGLCLLDFEHTHIGIGLADLAHLYVNLITKGDTENAHRLLNTYQAEVENREMDFNTPLFQAIVLERAAGKLNAMRQTTGERAARLRELLLT